VPSETGFAVSWVEEADINGSAKWVVDPQIRAPSQGAVWAYTPQQLHEGWLRYNPTILEFSLLETRSKRPTVQAGVANALSLVITNRKTGPISFKAGTLACEGTDTKGSIFYVHFGSLLAAADVAKLSFAATGWSFQRYGAYWAAAPAKDATIAPREAITIAVTGLTPATGIVQAQIYFDYYRLDGVSDGVSVELVSVQSR
jgi:hypothetical protein